VVYMIKGRYFALRKLFTFFLPFWKRKL